MPFADVNAVHMYYEVQGTGDPLVVIPGGLMTSAMMGPLVSALASSRQVIAIEPQAHGHTADVDRPLTHEQLADDTAALVAYLGLARADVVGFSLGGEIALQTAILHLTVVRKLVVISGRFRSDGEYPEVRAFEQAFAPDMPALAQIREAYLAASPSSDGWAALVAKMRQLLGEEFDWSAQVAAITAPTLVVVGDADVLPVAHAVELFALLGGETPAAAMGNLSKAQLAVLPATTHFGIVQHPGLPAIVSQFLNGKA
jgi:pimeloyl-ACP methyl ester carboxylesterase